jgi:hypothetical protein
MVHSLMAFGMSEIDAWRCVHVMQGRTSVVLLQVQPAGSPPAPDAPPPLEPELIDAALDDGAGWRALDDGGWQYLRSIDWSREGLAALQADLSGLTALKAADGAD